ncbi:hypothetical protein K474DRAFT_632519 [Panus rudis PR-1116 ss-1]|nr:hypothetical protein K474DRAFT_632519 [Panus rudis PR-1116 ss-1]
MAMLEFDADSFFQRLCAGDDEDAILGYPDEAAPSTSHSNLHNHSSPSESPVLVSVSCIFHLDANLDALPTDLLLVSSDDVFFHLHRHILLRASTNSFSGLIMDCSQNRTEMVNVTETALVLTLVLSSIYALDCTEYAASLDVLLAVVRALKKYGIPVDRCIAPGTPLFQQIVAQAPRNPVEVYAVAAEYNAFELASLVSQHLISLDLSSISDELAARIGPVYLKRLFRLHQERMDVLKGLLLTPPVEHGLTLDCNFVDQKRLTRAWSLAAAGLAWEARPDLSASIIQVSLGSLGQHLSCSLCQRALSERVMQVVISWSMARRNI